MGAERTESEGFYEMLWDCDHCETKRLLGKSQRHCPSCGAPQNPDKRYFPKPEEQTRVDGHQYEGADRHCPACSAPMGAAANNCAQCGAPLDGSSEVRGVAAPVAPARPRRRIWPYVLAAIAVIVVAIWWFFIRTTEATLAVTGHRWKRAVAVEKYGDWPREAWRNEVPAAASSPVLCTSRQRSTRQVPDGESCHTERVDRKDGTFEQVKKCSPKYRSEPVMDDWCSFSVRAWQKVDEVAASGNGLAAIWPAAAPAADVQPVVGATRGGARSETFTLDFGDGHTCDVSEAVWRKYADGAKVKLEVRARSGKVVCSSL